jgi:hypothetical protein
MDVSALSSFMSSGLAWATVRPRPEAMGEKGFRRLTFQSGYRD